MAISGEQKKVAEGYEAVKIREELTDRRLKFLHLPWEIVRYKDGLDTTVLDRHAVEEFPAVKQDQNDDLAEVLLEQI